MRSVSGGFATVVGSETLLLAGWMSATLLVTFAVVVTTDAEEARTLTLTAMFGALVPLAMLVVRVHVTI
jgi:hypothetical protein